MEENKAEKTPEEVAAEELEKARHAWKHKELDELAKAEKVVVPGRMPNRAQRRKGM